MTAASLKKELFLRHFSSILLIDLVVKIIEQPLFKESCILRTPPVAASVCANNFVKSKRNKYNTL